MADDTTNTTDVPILDEQPQPNGAEAEVGAVAELTEEERYWKNVSENAADFNSWTYLIQIVERQGDIDKIRSVYDGFLGEFPLCYVYWKKYADHESTRSNIEKAIETYERGVAAIPHSVDLWTYYCTFVGEKSDDLEYIRSLWERAASTVGTDFVAHLLWDKYIEFETSQEEYARVTALYYRILHIPIEQISQYYERYKTHANNRPLAELLNAEEAAAFEEEKQRQEQKYKELAAQKGEGESISQDEMLAAGVKSLDEVELEFRSKIMANREELHKHTLEEVNKRRTFEYGVLKRPYFHVKPLDDAQLSNWRKYLDFEEKEGDPDRIIKLYERCLIACCYYSEFWLRYTNWLDSHRSVEEVRSVYERAVNIFLKRRPDIHLEYAAFEEAHGNVTKARQIYENLIGILPGHVESTLRLVSFERRQKNYEAACSIFETAVSITSLDAKSGPFLSMQYARFLENAMGNPSRARDIYEKALEKFPENKNLWLAYINFEFNQGGMDMETRVQALYSRALAEDSRLSSDDKYDLWQNNLEFVADWGSDIQQFRKLSQAFRAAFPASKAESKKRPLDSDTTGAQAKQPRTAAYTAPTAAYGYTYPQYAATYPTAAYAASTAASAASYQYPYTAQSYQAWGYTYPYAAYAQQPSAS